MKPKAFKKARKATNRVAKIATAKEAIGTIEKDSDTFILTFGQFSLIDALVTILDQTGPATVDMATWTAADAHLERTYNLMQSSAITRLRMIVDYSFESRQPAYCHHMRERFGTNCIRAIRTHAKFMVIRNDDWNIVLRTSMNLNENPRLENIEISECREFADFFEKLTDEIFKEVAENERRSATLDLKNIPESYPFKSVEAYQIPLIDLKEPETTHILRKL